jgi:small subunit ribosomal protein S15
MDQALKQTLKNKYQTHKKDTGSANIQIALLTERIKNLTAHLKDNKKDHSSRYGLIKMISRRRKLLDYLSKKDEQTYQSLLKSLKLRR